MKFLILLCTLLLPSVALTAQTPSGHWLLEKALVNGKTIFIYQTITFHSNGNIKGLGISIGTWEYLPQSFQVFMKSDFDKDFNGKSKVLALSEHELILEKDGVKYFYAKIDPKKIMVDNKKSDILGVWKITALHEAHYLKFTLPDQFTYLEIFEGGTSKTSGSWIYQPKDNSLIIVARSHFCDKKNIILSKTPTSFELKNGTNSFRAVRIPFPAYKPEHLNFTKKDLDKPSTTTLPWENLEKNSFFQKDKEIDYQKSDFLDSLGIFETSPLILIRNTNSENNITVKCKISFSKETEPFETSSTLDDSPNSFFPLEEPLQYRAVGQETLTVAAGTFNCTAQL